eukprot:scpid73405/ scgid28202/ 
MASGYERFHNAEMLLHDTSTTMVHTNVTTASTKWQILVVGECSHPSAPSVALDGHGEDNLYQSGMAIHDSRQPDDGGRTVCYITQWCANEGSASSRALSHCNL